MKLPPLRCGDLLRVAGRTSFVAAMRITPKGIVVDLHDRTPSSMASSRTATVTLDLLNSMFAGGVLRVIARAKPLDVPTERRTVRRRTRSRSATIVVDRRGMSDPDRRHSARPTKLAAAPRLGGVA